MIELPLIMFFIMTVPLQVSDIVEDELEGIIDMAVEDWPKGSSLFNQGAKSCAHKPIGG